MRARACNVLSGDLRKGWYSAKISLQSPPRPDYIMLGCAISFLVRSLDSVPLVSFSSFRLMVHSLDSSPPTHVVC
jgi:hypothetical protein